MNTVRRFGVSFKVLEEIRKEQAAVRALKKKLQNFRGSTYQQRELENYLSHAQQTLRFWQSEARKAKQTRSRRSR